MQLRKWLLMRAEEAAAEEELMEERGLLGCHLILAEGRRSALKRRKSGHYVRKWRMEQLIEIEKAEEYKSGLYFVNDVSVFHALMKAKGLEVFVLKKKGDGFFSGPLDLSVWKYCERHNQQGWKCQEDQDEKVKCFEKNYYCGNFRFSPGFKLPKYGGIRPQEDSELPLSPLANAYK